MKTYQMGRVIFSVAEASEAFMNDLDILLCAYTPSPKDQVINVQCRNDLRLLQNEIFGLHSGYLWLDAGCLINAEGKSVLITGPSGAGKSTTTMALALGYDWRVIAEDILLIDINSDTLISLGAPFSLKKGTYELLLDTVDRAPEPLFHDEWSPMGNMWAGREHTARFDLAIAFGARSVANAPIETISLSASQYLRKTLALSNILRIDPNFEKMLHYLRDTKCFAIDGGTLRERLDLLLQLTA